jgi:hypothetical protein
MDLRRYPSFDLLDLSLCYHIFHLLYPCMVLGWRNRRRSNRRRSNRRPKSKVSDHFALDGGKNKICCIPSRVFKHLETNDRLVFPTTSSLLTL